MELNAKEEYLNFSIPCKGLLSTNWRSNYRLEAKFELSRGRFIVNQTVRQSWLFIEENLEIKSEVQLVADSLTYRAVGYNGSAIDHFRPVKSIISVG